MHVAILILNYNGRELLAECLPSIVRAAAHSRHACEVIVIDNDSRDDSMSCLAERFPGVRVICRPNRGLCSFNDVIFADPSAAIGQPVAVLLNNDIKLSVDAIDPLIAPFAGDSTPPSGVIGDDGALLAADSSPVFFTAPQCWQFDGLTCEGFKTAVRWRHGLVQATGRFSGHEQVINAASETACAGAALAVDCRLFAQLGGFDPLYLPGRLEDLDLAYRAFSRGFRLLFVPDSVVFHKGLASFGAEFGKQRCDRLALRNTLLFQWKNLRRPVNIARQLCGGAARIGRDVLQAPFVQRSNRWVFVRALREAWTVWRANAQQRPKSGASLADGAPKVSRWAAKRMEREFFRRFHATALIADAAGREASTQCESTNARRATFAPSSPAARQPVVTGSRSEGGGS